MSTASVPNRSGKPFPQKKKTMKLFYHLLSDMKHQRVAVIALALGQAVNIYQFCDFFYHYCDKRPKIFFIDFSHKNTHLTLFRHSRIVHYFWCVLGWSMPNKYHDYWLSIAWIKKNVKNITKHRKFMACQPTIFASWKLISSSTTHWLFCIVQPP